MCQHFNSHCPSKNLRDSCSYTPPWFIICRKLWFDVHPNVIHVQLQRCRKMFQYGWALRACVLWFADVHAINHILSSAKELRGLQPHPLCHWTVIAFNNTSWNPEHAHELSSEDASNDTTSLWVMLLIVTQSIGFRCQLLCFCQAHIVGHRSQTSWNPHYTISCLKCQSSFFKVSDHPSCIIIVTFTDVATVQMSLA